jgi:hypothetical protein
MTKFITRQDKLNYKAALNDALQDHENFPNATDITTKLGSKLHRKRQDRPTVASFVGAFPQFRELPDELEKYFSFGNEKRVRKKEFLNHRV